ncbi:serine hydrolase [Spirosoma spitsbergense]|uniref:serine hydrolase n=1 Tax=Spirosoma spitsbergense TaxID=431554 RepID=UPI0012F8599E|nr:serine hydrolase [Spirosoma spitsbergense]
MASTTQLLFVLFSLLMSSTTARSQSQNPAFNLADSLTSYLKRLPPAARVSLSTRSLVDATLSFAYRADVRVPSASVIKLPIMLELMERVKAGMFNLDAMHTLTEAEKVGGDGVLQTYADQSRVSYRELLRLMLIKSDNTATNIIIHLLGRDAINQRLRKSGLERSQLNRVMMDTLAAKQGRENYVTAQEMNALLEKVYRHQVATPEGCEAMLTILKQNEDVLTIPRLLPKSVVIAHKTGTLAYVRGDAGIVYAEKPFLLAVFVEGVPTPEAERIIGEVVLICYTYFN